MTARRGERILGPYEQVNGWRIIEVADDGDRTYTLFPTEAKASKYKELLEADLASGDHTTGTALEAYEKHLEAKGLKEDTIRQTLWALGRFFPEPIVLKQLTHKRCEKLYEVLRTQTKDDGSPRFSVDSHRGMLSQVRQFLSWCIERGWLKDNPCAGVKGMGKRRPRGKSLGKSGNELRVKQARAWYVKALELADDGDQGAIAALVALLLGMRASEITTRQVGDLDHDEQPGDLLWIPCSKTPAGRRTLEVPEVLRPLLVECAEAKQATAYLFECERPHELGKAHRRCWVKRQIHRICDAAEVPRITAHALRGLLATLTAERGLAGHLIAATLGHEHETTTMTSYAQPGAAGIGARRRGQELLEKRPN